MRSEAGRWARAVQPEARKSQEDGEVVAQIGGDSTGSGEIKESDENELRPKNLAKRNERDDSRLASSDTRNERNAEKARSAAESESEKKEEGRGSSCDLRPLI